MSYSERLSLCFILITKSPSLCAHQTLRQVILPHPLLSFFFPYHELLKAKPSLQSQSSLSPETATEPETHSAILLPSQETSPAASAAASCASAPEDQPGSDGETVLSIHHLDKFSLPPGYPQSIADIIRCMTTPPELLDSFLPNRLHQILRIGYSLSHLSEVICSPPPLSLSPSFPLPLPTGQWFGRTVLW
jgi:hypothetical protein